MDAPRCWNPVWLLGTLLLLLVLSSCGPSGPTDEPPGGGDDEPLTREAAIDLLLEQVVQPDSLEAPLIAFSLDAPLAAGSEVAPYAPVDLPADVTELPFLVPRTLERDAWFFWVDDEPFAQFAHPTRYVFIDAQTGAVEVQEEAWWPYIDGEPVEAWIGAGRWDPANWGFSNVSEADAPDNEGVPDTRRPAGAFLLSQTALRPAAAQLSGEAIVAVNGWAPGHGTDAGFSGDMLQARAFSRASGIPIYEPSGNTLADIEASIQQAIDAGAVDIFFYFTGHGGRTADGRFWRPFRGTAIWTQDLVALLQKFASRVRFKTTIQGCYSGGWVTPLQDSGVVDIVIASSAADEVSYGDWDPTGDNADPNPADVGSEFSSGLWEDLGEILNDPAQQAEARRVAKLQNRTEFVGWLILANVSAAAKDATFKADWTHPQLWVNSTAPTKEVAHAETAAAFDAAGGQARWIPEPLDLGTVDANGRFTATTLPDDHPLLGLEPVLATDGIDTLYFGTMGNVDGLSINVSLFNEGDPAFVPSINVTFDSGSLDAPVRPSYEINPLFPGDTGVCVAEGAVLFDLGIPRSELIRLREGSIWIYQLQPDSTFDLAHFTFTIDLVEDLQPPGDPLATPLPREPLANSIPIFAGAGEDELSLGIFERSPALEIVEFGECAEDVFAFETSP